jgi:hypothetical protein
VVRPVEQRVQFEGVLLEACRSHLLKLELRSLLRQAVAKELVFQGKTKDVNSILSQVGLNTLISPGVIADAAVVALCGLPTS